MNVFFHSKLIITEKILKINKGLTLNLKGANIVMFSSKEDGPHRNTTISQNRSVFCKNCLFFLILQGFYGKLGNTL